MMSGKSYRKYSTLANYFFAILILLYHTLHYITSKKIAHFLAVVKSNLDVGGVIHMAICFKGTSRHRDSL